MQRVRFIKESLAAIQSIGRPAVFLTGLHWQGSPHKIAAGRDGFALRARSAQLLPRASVIVHQGGVGTAAQAMRDGRPMLVVPFGHDQFDNAARLCQLGVAKVLYRSQYKAATALRKVLQQLFQERITSNPRKNWVNR